VPDSVTKGSTRIPAAIRCKQVWPLAVRANVQAALLDVIAETEKLITFIGRNKAATIAAGELLVNR
jgi:hypothetical protein